MSYRRDLKRLRQARKLAKRQQHQLASVELAGMTAVTLHSATQKVTIAIDRATGAPLVDVLHEALLERRQTLQAAEQQVRQDWQESEQLHARRAPLPGPTLS